MNFFTFLSLFAKSTETTCGITSPALCILIVSPILISFLLISSSLCKVAFETTTGSFCLQLPGSILFIFVYALSAENL